jgi:hypothetical protein
MYPMPGACPVCGETLEVVKLHCGQCGTTIEGRFALGRLSRLNAEQLHFVETFIRCEGTLKRVQAELDMSYPTVRARLNDVIRAMGYEVIEEQPSGVPEIERSAILDRLYRGEITTEEALDELGGV